MESIEKLMQLADEAAETENYDEAMKYYSQAAEQGNALAM